MAYPGPKQLSATSAFVQSAGAKLLIIGLNAATGILAARALAPAGRGELSAMILWYYLSRKRLQPWHSQRSHLPSPPPPGANVRAKWRGLDALAGNQCGCLSVGFFGLPHWIPQYSPQVLFFARIFLLNTPVAVFMVVGRAALESQGDFTASNLSLIGPPLLTLAGLLLLLFTHTFTPVNAAWCYVLSGLPPLIWMGRSFHRAVRPRFRHLSQISAAALLLWHPLLRN